MPGHVHALKPEVREPQWFPDFFVECMADLPAHMQQRLDARIFFPDVQPGLFGLGTARVIADLDPVPDAFCAEINGFKVGVEAAFIKAVDLVLSCLLCLERKYMY